MSSVGENWDWNRLPWPAPRVLLSLTPRTYMAVKTTSSSDPTNYTALDPVALSPGNLYVGIRVTNWGTDATSSSKLYVKADSSWDGTHWFTGYWSNGSGYSGATAVNWYSGNSSTSDVGAPWAGLLVPAVPYVRFRYLSLYDNPTQSADAQLTFELSYLNV